MINNLISETTNRLYLFEPIKNIYNQISGSNSFPLALIYFLPSHGFFIKNHPSIGRILVDRSHVILKFLNTYIKPYIPQKPMCFYSALADGYGSLVSDIDPQNIPFILADRKKNDLHFHHYLFPDTYLLSGDYEGIIANILLQSSKTPFANRIPLACWRGNQTGGTYNLETMHILPRSRLVWLSHKHPHYVNARFIDYHCQVDRSNSGNEYVNIMNRTFGDNPRKNHMSYARQLIYKFLPSLDGNTVAWRRPCEILHTGSILLMHSNHDQYFSQYLEEEVHYVKIQPDMSDFIQTIDRLRANPDLCENISKNGQEFANEILTYDFIKEYTKILFVGISSAFETISEESFIKLFELENKNLWIR